MSVGPIFQVEAVTKALIVLRVSQEKGQLQLVVLGFSYLILHGERDDTNNITMNAKRRNGQKELVGLAKR
jgi:hypothetical protein